MIGIVFARAAVVDRDRFAGDGMRIGEGDDGSLGDPALSIADPRGKAVSEFTADSGSDSGLGFDASYTFTAARSGEYTITVTGEGVLTGDYVLQVGVATAAMTAAFVSSSTITGTVDARFAVSNMRQTDIAVAIAAAGFLAMPSLGHAAQPAQLTDGDAGPQVTFAVAPASDMRSAGIDSVQPEAIADPLAGMAAPAQAPQTAPRSAGEQGDGPALAAPEAPAASLAPGLSIAENISPDIAEMAAMIAIDDGAAMHAALALTVAEQTVEKVPADAAALEAALAALGDAGDVDALIDAAVAGQTPPEALGDAELAAMLDGIVDAAAWASMLHGVQLVAVDAEAAAQPVA